jgi:hypothetical protein
LKAGHPFQKRVLSLDTVNRPKSFSFLVLLSIFAQDGAARSQDGGKGLLLGLSGSFRSTFATENPFLWIENNGLEDRAVRRGFSALKCARETLPVSG